MINKGTTYSCNVGSLRKSSGETYSAVPTNDLERPALSSYFLKNLIS